MCWVSTKTPVLKKAEEPIPVFIHAYTNKFSTSPRYCIVLCKIHKGTKYYVSAGGDEICASKMELIKII